MYAIARRDFEYLESVKLIDDFVEIDAQVIDLMREPTKRKAGDLYMQAISLWFLQHGFQHDDRVREIAERYGWEA